MPHPVTMHTLWIATAVAVLVPSAADPDLWGHLLFGSALLAGDLPLENTFAYTTPTQPWLNHELLAELAMAGTWRLGGSAGLVALKVALGLATAAILWRTARRRSSDSIAATIAVVLALVVMRPGFMIRPQLFTMLFLAAVLALATATAYRPRGRAWLVPVLVVLWVNVHGGVLAGVGLVGVGAVATAATAAWRRTLGLREAAALAAWLLVLAAALLANPYGARLVRFLLFDVTPQVPITEWAPVTIVDGSFPAFKLMLLVVAAGLVALRPTVAEAAIVVAAAAVALRHQRHVPLFAIAAAPLVAATFAAALRRLAVAATGRVPALGRLGLGAAVAVQVAAAVAAIGAWRGTIAVSPHHYPVQAARFLTQNGITGNVALPFRWGEYALWALPEGSRVAVDGRFTTAYPGPLLEQAWRFMTGGPGWDALLTEYPTDIVLADRAQAPAHLLQRSDEWVYVYSDPVSLVFVRRTPRHADVLARFEAGALHYDRTPVPTTFPAAGRHRLDTGGSRGRRPKFREQKGRPASATVVTAWRS